MRFSKKCLKALGQHLESELNLNLNLTPTDADPETLA